MILTQPEITELRSLQTQEESCVQKYGKYAKEAHDTVLKDLFTTIQKHEQKHYDSLEQIINGTVPCCDVNDSAGKNYSPVATYSTMDNSQEKKDDCFMATDCIGTEKLVSSEYNSGVFVFENSDVRKLLADIQVEEQNHAEMIYKYKMVNSMQ